MSTFAYLLVKKVLREEDSRDLSAQEGAIGKYASTNSLQIVEWVRERGIQADLPLSERPEWQRLIKKMSLQSKKPHTVIFSSFALFGTTPNDALSMLRWCIDQNIHLHFVDLGGDILKDHKEVVLGICESFVQGARSEKSARATKSRNIKHQNEPLLYLGGIPPFGFREEDGKLVEEPFRKEVLAFIVTCHVDDEASIRKIQVRLKEERKQNISIFVIQKLLKTAELQDMIQKRKLEKFKKQIDSIL